MSEIKSNLETYVQTCEKIKLLKRDLKELTDLKDANEEKIKVFLRAQGYESITYKSHSIEIQQVKKNEPQRRGAEKNRVLDILRKHRVPDPEEVLKDIQTKTKIQVDKLRLH